MTSNRIIVYGVTVALAGIVTVFLFQHFDATSHSASDTLRPTLMVGGPLWIVMFVIAQSINRMLRR